MNPKIITMYLPQFHRTIENDEWWGEGFTEWTAVRKAVPLFEGHLQPRIPLNNNYYNLLKKETMVWQADLMKKYGVYGQCFYHYYFKDGRKILEKPAENLLKWRDIEMPFCFSWANESWVTSWSNIVGGNAWSERFEKEKSSETGTGILIKQSYGQEKEWIEHFMYLLPFFLDERYIKKGNKPLFIIYKPFDIPCLGEMKNVWNHLAIQHGFDGVFFIGTSSNPDQELDGILSVEPQTTIANVKSFQGENTIGAQQIIDGEELSREIIHKKVSVDTYLCGTPGFDTSPRKGRYSQIIVNLTPDVFYRQMHSIISISKTKGKEFVFVNAWNEWGEGMYLEPDANNGYRYLEALKKASDDADLEPFYGERNDGDMLSTSEWIKTERYRGYWRLFDHWMELLESDIHLTDYFLSHHLRHIAVYGIGMMGRHFSRQLKNSSIVIQYYIDKKSSILKKEIPVFTTGDSLPEVDAVVVCVTYDKSMIKKSLEGKVSCPVLFLDQIVSEMWENHVNKSSLL